MAITFTPEMITLITVLGFVISALTALLTFKLARRGINKENKEEIERRAKLDDMILANNIEIQKNRTWCEDKFQRVDNKMDSIEKSNIELAKNAIESTAQIENIGRIMERMSSDIQEMKTDLKEHIRSGVRHET